MNPKNRLAKGAGTTLGQSGTTIFSGYITNEEYNRNLSGTAGLKIFERMRKSDATVRSALQICKLPILSAEWTIEPASDDAKDIEVAEIIERELFEVHNFDRFLREATTCFEFGHAVAEKTLEYRKDKGYIGIKSLEFRKQTTIQKWEADGKPGITQLTVDGHMAPIPRAKLMYFINDLEGENWQGVSLLRYAYKHFDIKDKLDKVQAISLEKMAMGVPIVKAPQQASEAEKELAKDAVQSLRAHEQAYQMIPLGWELEMLDMKASTTKDVLPTIQYHDRQILISVLAQFLALGGSDASGSRAVSSDHSKLFMLSEEAAAKTIRSVIQEELIDQLCEINWTDLPNGCPQLKFAGIRNNEAGIIAESVQKLMSVGAMNYDAPTENHLRRMMDLPEVDEETAEDPKPTKQEPNDDPTIKEEEEPDDIEASLKQAKEARRELVNAIMGQ